MISHALVRPPGDSYANAISSNRAPIDVALAQAQHAEYCQALVAVGLQVEALPPDERYPDSCFMQDPALVIAGQAIILRPGAASRRGEEELLVVPLAQRFPLARIVEPGTVEGGDVMVLPGRVRVGLSGRTNRAGVDQLAAILAPAGLPVTGLPVDDSLHLLSAANYVGRGTMLVAEPWAGRPEFAGFDLITVPPDEAYAANVLGLGDSVIVPAGYPQVARALRERGGFELLIVPVSEFAKADGGVTCLALTW